MAGRHHGTAAVPKVPDVNTWFWTVKILTTAMGEAVSDYLVKQYNPYLAVLGGFILFAVAITWQFRVPDYRTWPYWTAVAMVAVFGTMVADAMHVGLGIPYKVSMVFFTIVLAAVFTVWYLTERTLSIHSITTPRRELFYWATVCCTFALGTATGDWTAVTLHLGYFASGVLFTLAICVPLAAWKLGANPVLTFWVAYILTRPIGASFADYFGMPSPTCIASATIVPNTATIATAVQYGHVRYVGTRNCQPIAIANTTNPINTARYGLYCFTRKSDTASPIAVVRIFRPQK